MSLGEHLDELRRRLIIALVGFGVALVFCLIYSKDVMAAFCAPLIEVLLERDLNPQMFYTAVSDPFVVFIRISIISALALAAPWILYQMWLFVAAGLYPHERKWVMRFAPLSLALLVGGMVFVYYIVLPWTVVFFIDFAGDIPLPADLQPADSAIVTTLPATTQPFTLQAYPGDPPEPLEHQLWINTRQGRLKIWLEGKARVIPFGPQNLAAPMITLPEYINLVLQMLITFGLCFQLPLVVMALAKTGIVPIESLRSYRRYVYFVMAIVASVITPGDAITATVALIVPLILLYEMGIWLARMGRPGTADPAQT